MGGSGAEQSEEICCLTPALLKHWSYGREQSGAERRNLLPCTSPSKALVLWGGNRAERRTLVPYTSPSKALVLWGGSRAERSKEISYTSLIPALLSGVSRYKFYFCIESMEISGLWGGLLEESTPYSYHVYWPLQVLFQH